MIFADLAVVHLSVGSLRPGCGVIPRDVRH